MSVISMKQLLEAGVHFGHQTRRWNPKMAQYIFTERNGIYIIDLQKTVRKAGGSVHVCARQSQPKAVIDSVRRHEKTGAAIASNRKPNAAGMFYVNDRWLGGMLTNYQDHPPDGSPASNRINDDGEERRLSKR